ncbi:MAG: hypothetical protein RLZZ558_758 [Planctomycetota bacterium]|jgi:hypothetical protein
MIMAAWTPLLQPLPGAIHWWWIMVVPMVLGVSVVWKAVRLPAMHRYWREVAMMSMQVLLGMVALAAGLMILVRVIVPMLPAD